MNWLFQPSEKKKPTWQKHPEVFTTSACTPTSHPVLIAVYLELMVFASSSAICKCLRPDSNILGESADILILALLDLVLAERDARLVLLDDPLQIFPVEVRAFEIARRLISASVADSVPDTTPILRVLSSSASFS